MSDVVTFVLSVACAGILVIIWRLLTCLERVSTASLRSNDRERQEILHFIERLIERKDAVGTPENLPTTRTHTYERAHAVSELAREVPPPIVRQPEPEETPGTVEMTDKNISSVFQ